MKLKIVGLLRSLGLATSPAAAVTVQQPSYTRAMRCGFCQFYSLGDQQFVEESVVNHACSSHKAEMMRMELELIKSGVSEESRFREVIERMMAPNTINFAGPVFRSERLT